MALDDNALRAAGLPASLISLLVSITRAAERAQAAANSAAAANDLAPQLQAAVQALDELNIAPDLDARLRAVVSRVAEIDVVLSEVPQASEFEASATAAATAALQQALAELPLPVVDIDLEGDSLIMILSDGSRVFGAQLPAGGPVGTQIAPELSGGSLEFDGQDLVTVAPELLRGAPAPQVTLALTRDGVDVTDELVDGRIPDAPLGNYLAVWIAANGVLPNSTRTTSLVVAAPALVAPSVTATASISRSQTSSVLDGPDDVVSGNPEPSPTYQWFDGNTPISGANGKSYDPGSALGAFSRQTTWSNGVGLPAVSRSNTITIAAVPSIEAEISPNPPVAGQPFTITFNVSLAANEVTSNVPLTGSGDTRSGVAPTDDTINISGAASKAGYTSLPFVFDVVPPVAELFVASSPAVFGFSNLSSTTSTFALSAPAQFAGTGSVSTSRAINGPEPYIEPSVVTVSGNPPAVGETLRRRKGAFLSRHQNKPGFTWDWYANDTKLTHTEDDLLIGPEHAGVWFSSPWRAEDASGVTYGENLAVAAVPAASASITSNFTAADGTTIADYSGTPDAGRTFDKFGSASVLGVITSGYLHGMDTNGTGFVAASDNVSSGNYRVTAVMHSVIGSPAGGTTDRGVYPAVGIKAGNTGFLFRNDLSGQGLRIVKYAAGTLSLKVGGVTSIVGKDEEYTFVFEVTGTSCKVFINGAEVPGLAFTDADLAGGMGGYHHLRGGFDYNKLNALTVEAI